MSSRTNRDRGPLIAMGVILILAFGYTGIRIWHLSQRDVEIADVTLERTEQLFRLRLDGVVRDLVDDLNEEAAAVSESYGQLPSELVLRWRPLLASHWPITGIRLADERGSETSLVRVPSGFLLEVTTEGSKEGTVIMASVNNDAMEGRLDSVWISDVVNDPREKTWFSRALEDARNEPTWNLVSDTTSRQPLLQLSTLVRGKKDLDPYRVMALDVDLSRSGLAQQGTSPQRRYGLLLLDGDGHMLPFPGVNMDPGSNEAEIEAARQWTSAQTRWPFTMERNGSRYRAMITPYRLNGQTLYTGVVLDMGSMDVWGDPEANSVVVMGALLILLAVLLSWLRIRRRHEDEWIRKQVKRNRSQERRLVKALGEREVLNREVHHRVKNNLQVVSSLLNLQATRLDEGPIKQEFMRGKRRIDTIALVHHKLYASKDLRNVDLDQFIKGLIEALAVTHQPASNAVSYEVFTSGLHTDQDTAIELGIIVCELVANTYQHAFPYSTGGHVDIKVNGVEGDLYRLVVKDNGRGFMDGDRNGSGKLGLEIVEALAEQLDGSFHIRANGGVTFEVLFRMRPDRLPAEPPEA